MDSCNKIIKYYEKDMIKKNIFQFDLKLNIKISRKRNSNLEVHFSS